MQISDPRAVELYHDKINSSADSWHRFKTSPIWMDMKAWLEERQEIVKDAAMEAEDIEQLRGLQGASDIITQVLLLPDAFINYLKEE